MSKVKEDVDGGKEDSILTISATRLLCNLINIWPLTTKKICPNNIKKLAEDG